MNETSLSLLDSIRKTSDSASWNRLVALYTPLLKRWVRRYEVQDADAEDIVQEVLAAVAQDLPKFQHNQQTGAFRSWLRTILVNRVRRFWRSRDHQPVSTGTSSIDKLLNQLQDEASEVSQIWNREHDNHVLKRLMRGIQQQFIPQTWQAFYLQAIDGQRADAVAQDLGMSLSSVYMAKSRVLNALRRESDGLIDKV